MDNIKNIQEIYNKYNICKYNYGPDNKLCKKYHNEFSKLMIPFINKRLYNKTIIYNRDFIINIFPW